MSVIWLSTQTRRFGRCHGIEAIKTTITQDKSKNAFFIVFNFKKNEEYNICDFLFTNEKAKKISGMHHIVANKYLSIYSII